MFLSDIASAFMPDWNLRILTEHDALRICNENSVHLVEDVNTRFGKIVFHRGYVFIVMNPDLSPAMRLWVLWHEIGHFMLHAPASSRFTPMIERKNDREANYLAAIALMPKTLVVGKTVDQIIREYSYPRELVNIRKQISEIDGI